MKTIKVRASGSEDSRNKITQGPFQANIVKPKNRYKGGREVLTSGPRKEGRSRWRERKVRIEKKVLTLGKY